MKVYYYLHKLTQHKDKQYEKSKFLPWQIPDKVLRFDLSRIIIGIFVAQFIRFTWFNVNPAKICKRTFDKNITVRV